MTRLFLCIFVLPYRSLYLAVFLPFDASPLEFFAAVACEGGDAHEGEEEVEKDVFHKTKDDGAYHIEAADLKLLRVDTLKESGDRQDGSVSSVQEIESNHERDAQIPHDSCKHGDKQAEYFDKRGEKLIHQIIDVGDGSDQPVP